MAQTINITGLNIMRPLSLERDKEMDAQLMRPRSNDLAECLKHYFNRPPEKQKTIYWLTLKSCQLLIVLLYIFSFLSLLLIHSEPIWKESAKIRSLGHHFKKDQRRNLNVLQVLKWH